MNTRVIVLLSMLAFVTNSLGQQVTSDTPQPNYPPYFTGTNIEKLLVQLKRSNKLAGKQGEFETSADYRERVNKSTDNVSTNGSLTFVFTPKQLKFSYDPDNGQLKLLIDRKERDTYAGQLEIAYSEKLIGTYSASNSFGAKATIKKVKSHSLVLQYDYESFSLGGEMDGRVALDKVTMTVPPNLAKELKNNIAIAYVGRLRAPYHDVFLREWGAPTISDPYEWASETESIYIDLSQVTVFNFKTGKVYKSLSVPELVSEGKEQREKYVICERANGYSHLERCGTVGFNFVIPEL